MPRLDIGTGDLPTDATMIYNGIAFDHLSYFKVKAVPNYDKTNRVITFVNYSFDITGYVCADDPSNADLLLSSTDAQMAQVRQQLMQPGGPLVIQATGFGNIAVPTIQGDVRYGPMPRGISFMGYAKGGWQINFQVDLQLGGECADRLLTNNQVVGFLEYSFKSTFSVDRIGYGKRTFVGRLVLAAVRGDIPEDGALVNADTPENRAIIAPPVPFYFMRTGQTWEASDDKTTLTGTITDEQCNPNLPPLGCVVADGNQHAEAKGPMFFDWQNTLTVTYTVAANFNRGECYRFFTQLVRDRINNAYRVLAINPLNGQGANVSTNTNGAVKSKVVIPTRWSMDDPLYSSVSGTLSASWRAITSAQEALQASGMWRPTPSGINPVGAQGPVDTTQDWAQWIGSLGNAFSTGGLANIGFDKELILVNLCSTTPFQALMAGDTEDVGFEQPAATWWENILSAPNFAAAILVAAFGEDAPDADESWLRYEMSLRIEVTDHISPMQLLPLTPIIYAPADPGDEGDDGYTLPYAVPSDGSATTIVQYRTHPTVYVVLTGYAERVNFDIAAPQLAAWGGITPVPANRDGVEFFETKVIGNVLFPVVGARFRLRWLIPGVPGTPIGSPATPILDSPSTEPAADPGSFTQGGSGGSGGKEFFVQGP